MTCTSVGESSTIIISAIGLSSLVVAASSEQRAWLSRQELIFGKRFRQILFRTDQPAARAIEQPVLARQHDYRRVFKRLIVLDERARLVTIQPAAS